MLRNAFFAAFLAELMFGAWVMHLTSTPMRPYRQFLLHTYGVQFGCYAGALLLTLTLALLIVFRTVFLSAAGQKLQHATKELHQGDMQATPETIFHLLQNKR